ncbi:uncharacterized protein LOC134207312 [Armigeres subalbatus]|uniref:uncharacterized protein LOC134207312 n=1 Tax=Armigeres subalbatus TaxID=124917 RepID=UPI002ED0C303
MDSAPNGTNTPKTPVVPGQSSCVNCDRPDRAGDLVQCDTCDSWWHQTCAGVTSSVAERAWSCRLCFIEVSSKQTTSSIRSARVALQFEKLKEQMDMERRFLEEKYKLLEAECDAREETASRRSKISKHANIDKVRKWIGENAGHVEGAIGPADDNRAAASTLPLTTLNQSEAVAVDTTNSVSAMNIVEFQTSPLKHPEIPVRQQELVAERPISVPQSAPHAEGSTGAAESLPALLLYPLRPNPEASSTQPLKSPGPAKNKGAIPKVPKPVNQTQWEKRPDKVCKSLPQPPVQPSQGKPHQTLPYIAPAQPSSDHEILQQLIHQLGNMIRSHPEQNPPCHNAFSGTSNSLPQSNIAPPLRDVPIASELSGVSEYVPTPSQLAARQVMPRDLPQFSGNPADWPVFISSFKNSTLACGYTRAENLCRLQRCLKGAAYEAVQSRLLLPESVPHVLDTLCLLYGRPELLIHALLDKIRSVPAPKGDKLETLIDFGMAVQNLCDHLEAAGQHAHLSNPSLLMELVGKLPAHVKMEWGTYLRNFPEVNLKTFGNFMSNVVISASKVTVYSGVSGKSASEGTSKPKHRGMINAHSGGTEEVRLKEMLCYACRKPGHRLQECGRFKSLTVNDRWKCVQTNGLCRNCLCGHGRRSCRRTISCGLNGCQYRHHPLLHSVRTDTSLGSGGQKRYALEDVRTVKEPLFRNKQFCTTN